ncbi:MAG: hypothetical protein ABI682_04855 [Acidobacteriota bacterium]
MGSVVILAPPGGDGGRALLRVAAWKDEGEEARRAFPKLEAAFPSRDVALVRHRVSR